MRIHPCPAFLTNGTGTVPPGQWRAIAIHPSSEVDLVDVDGYLLAPGGIIPLAASTPQLKAVRNPLTGDQFGGLVEANNYTPADGEQEELGDSLVVQLYEACDQLVPPGPRVPFYKDVQIAAGALPTTAENALLAMRVPFHGRREAAIGMWRSTAAADLNLLVVGRSYGRRNKGLGASTSLAFRDAEGTWIEAALETWWDGAASAPAKTVEPGDLPAWGTVYVGGYGDAAECFDELLLYVWGPAGGLVRLTAEAYGERA